MQHNQTLNPQSPKPSLSKDVSNSPSVVSCGTVEDFEFSSDESLVQLPPLSTLPEQLVAMPRKRSNALIQSLSPQDDSFPKQEFNHSRHISLCSRRTRYSTVTDFDGECIPSLLFHTHESGEFDFCHQPDSRFSDMMSCNQGNIFEAHSGLENFTVLEHSDFEDGEQESNSMYFMGDSGTEDNNRYTCKSDDIDGLAVSSGENALPLGKELLNPCNSPKIVKSSQEYETGDEEVVSSGENALPLGKEHHSPFNSTNTVKSSQEYETDDEELISSPDCVEPVSYVAFNKKKHPVEEKLSEASTPERNPGVNFESKNWWVPVRKHRPFKTNYEIYRSSKKNSEGTLRNHLEKAISMPRRAQSESWRTSQVGTKFRKLGSLALRSNLRFCSPYPPEDKRTDACMVM